jgi:hypothetical protein
MLEPEKKHTANRGDLMFAMSWRFVAATKRHPKKMQSGAGKSRWGDEPQSIAADEPNFFAVDVARIRLGNFLEILCKLPAGGRPTGRPPADAIQSSMTIGSAI